MLEQGQLRWLDTPPAVTSAQVIVMILSPVADKIEDKNTVPLKSASKLRQLGFMRGDIRK